MIELKCLTTQEVARLCRVSDATVKRWEDAGLLKSERTSGGHRRFRVEEIVRFQREQGLGLKQCHGDESVTMAAVRRRGDRHLSESECLQALLSGCEEAAVNMFINAYLKGKSLTEIFDSLICPAMRQIGELWLTGEISITQEHLATRAAVSALHKLRHIIPVPRMTDKLAMCCAVEGDFHELPTHLAQMTIENEGWEVMNFGANTPLYSLAEEVLRNLPAMICISATVISDIDRLSRDYRMFTDQICKLKIPILVGGKVFKDEQIRHRFPAHIYAQSFAETAEFTRKLTCAN